MFLIIDAISHVGTVTVLKHDVKTGKLIYKENFKNQITNYALSQVALAWAGQSGINYPNTITVGTGTPPAGQSGTLPTDTMLWNELAGTRLTCTYISAWLTYYTQYSVTYSQTQAIGTLTEAGLLDSGGNLWSHVILNNIVHDSTSTLTIQWQVAHIGN